MLTRRTLCSINNGKKEPFGSAIKALAATLFAQRTKATHTKEAAAVWKSTKQPHPHCEKHDKLAKIRVVKNLLKANYGRPFFVCSEQTNPCSFWAWGDVQAIAKPECRHGSQCAVRKVKKETVNKDRLFFCCAQEDSCNYFEWVPEESYSPTKFLPSTTSDFFLNGLSPSYF